MSTGQDWGPIQLLPGAGSTPPTHTPLSFVFTEHLLCAGQHLVC